MAAGGGVVAGEGVFGEGRGRGSESSSRNALESGGKYG